MARYASTGQEIPAPDEDAEMTPEAYKRLRKANPHAHALGKLAERREAEAEIQAKSEHDKAVENFDVHAADLHSPQLIREVLKEREALKEDAIKNRKVIDWHTAYPEIADKVRARAGLPSAGDRERYEAIAEMKRARGK